MISGAEIMVKCLQNEGVSYLFGYPGAAICPFYDYITKTDIKHVLVRQEQNAAHMANGYARASGKQMCIRDSFTTTHIVEICIRYDQVAVRLVIQRDRNGQIPLGWEAVNTSVGHINIV